MTQDQLGLIVALVIIATAVLILVNHMNKQDILNKLNSLEGKVDLLIAKNGGGEDLTEVGNRIDQIEAKVDDALSG